MNKIRLSRALYFSGIFIVSFCIFLAIFFLIEHYIHETGHIMFGFADNLLLKGKLTHFSISSWVPHPIIRFISLPQQTKIIENNYGSVNFMLGGPTFTMLVFFVISLLAYLRSKNPLWFILFFSIVLFEISGNVICGTDNLSGNPLPTCNHNLDLTAQYIAIVLFASTFSYFIAKKLTGKQLKIRRF